MPNRRILCLWFPRLGAERMIRAEPWLAGQPLAVVGEERGAQVITALSQEASEAGLTKGMVLRDAQAICAGLLTRPQVPQHEAAFLAVLHRWAGKFSPWVASEPPEALIIDLTGCGHLFGGEAQLVQQVTRDCTDLGLSVRVGLADTLGGAWALAHYARTPPQSGRTGDAIDQEAPATRTRAAKRRNWERGGAAPTLPPGPSPRAVPCIAPPGETRQALAPLPLAALRLEGTTGAELARLGLRRIGDLLEQPRAGLARRFGRGLVLRLDQALGAAPEPISPAKAPERFAVRLSFPDPIGLADDMDAALARVTGHLCKRLTARGRGARVLRLEAHRADHTMQWLTVTGAVASAQLERLLPLLVLKRDEIDAGPGIDMIRLEAVVHEPLHTRKVAGHAEATARNLSRKGPGPGSGPASGASSGAEGRAASARSAIQQSAALEDLIGRIGARVGMEAVTRHHPSESHIPEKGAQVLAAAWSQPAGDWPAPINRRPLTLWPPEPVTAPDSPTPPDRFRWRGRDWVCIGATGPERIAPEWWLDDPAWRSGPRDYWRIETDRGERLWMFYAHGAALSAGWFCHGDFG